MRTVLEALALIAVVAGTAFSIIGILGMLRLPDVYTRLHATGKVSTFGAVLLLVAAALVIDAVWARALIAIVLVLISGPVVSHALGSAALRIGIPLKGAVRDDLHGERAPHPRKNKTPE